MVIYLDWVYRNNQCVDIVIWEWAGGEVRRERRASICFVFWEEREKYASIFLLILIVNRRQKRNIYIVSQLVVGDERLIFDYDNIIHTLSSFSCN